MPDSSGLSERQKECLRLVARGLTSKEIAIELNTTYGVVDNYIAVAVRAIGVTSRREAARWLKDREATMVQQMHVQPQTVANPPKSIELDEPPERSEPRVPSRLWLARVARCVVQFFLGHMGGSRHELAHHQVLLAIGMAALLSTGFLAATLLIYYWLNHLFS